MTPLTDNRRGVGPDHAAVDVLDQSSESVRVEVRHVDGQLRRLTRVLGLFGPSVQLPEFR